MAKVKANFRNLKDSVSLTVSKALKDEKLLNEIGEVIVTNSKAESRLGRDPKTGASYAGFSGENAERYVKTRDRIAQRLGAGRNFKPSKSNLTITGQLLDSIKHRVENNKLIIEPTGFHKPYSSNSSTNTVRNEQLAEWHTRGMGGYPARRVLGINDKTKRIVKNLIDAFLRRTVKFQR